MGGVERLFHTLPRVLKVLFAGIRGDGNGFAHHDRAFGKRERHAGPVP